MSSVDPGLAIVVTVGVVLAVMLAFALLRRRSIRARMAELRDATRVEIEVVSQARASALTLATVLPIIFGTPFVAMALGDWGRAHAAILVCGLILLTMVAVLAPVVIAPLWTRVGSLSIDDASLSLDNAEGRIVVALDAEWTLSEAIVPPGNHVETVVVVTQGTKVLAFRYPNFIGDSFLAPERSLSPRRGVLLGHEARVVHERLRAFRAR